MPDLQRTVNLGGGVRVPYPIPTSAAASKIGQANRRADTKPEVAIRSALHRRGHRFRKDLLIRCEAVRVKPDIVFTRLKVAVFVDGCFWHGCPEHQHVPRSNQDYWVPKLTRNKERDLCVTTALQEAGWTVIRVWEHEPVDDVVEFVEETLRERRAQLER